MNAKREDIRARLTAILSEKLELVHNGDSLPEEVGLLGQGIGVDSIEILQLVTAIEEQFFLTIEDEELKPEHFSTVGSLITFIQQKLA